MSSVLIDKKYHDEIELLMNDEVVIKMEENLPLTVEVAIIPFGVINDTYYKHGGKVDIMRLGSIKDAISRLREIRKYMPVIYEMRSNHFYMHQNAMDVCIEVVKIQYSDEKRIKIKFFWWNLGYVGNPYRIFSTPDRLEIRRIDLNKYIDITDKIFIPRQQSGVPI